MAKMTYEFDTEKDRADIQIFGMASQMYSLLWDFDQELRRMAKYEEGPDAEFAARTREKLKEMMDEYNIVLEV
jgi:hypothetical protein